jgi:hypothetical protein
MAFCWAIGATLFLVAHPRIAEAQTPAAQMEFVRAELASLGLTEPDARARLAQNGINIDQIPLDELPQYQDRITAILDQLASEKRPEGTVGDSRRAGTGRDGKDVALDFEGVVNRSKLVKHELGRSVRAYVELAGGLLEQVQMHKAVVTNRRGNSRQLKRAALFFRSSPPVLSSSNINVPEKTEPTASYGEL